MSSGVGNQHRPKPSGSIRSHPIRPSDTPDASPSHSRRTTTDPEAGTSSSGVTTTPSQLTSAFAKLGNGYLGSLSSHAQPTRKNVLSESDTGCSQIATEALHFRQAGSAIEHQDSSASGKLPAIHSRGPSSDSATARLATDNKTGAQVGVHDSFMANGCLGGF